ncbi:MAG: response regulator [Limisphaerales bacterium]
MNWICGKSVLVVEDDAAMLRALSKVLSAEGAVVSRANWTGEALEHLTNKQERFDLVITDLAGPVPRGSSVLDAAKIAFPHVPVVIITASGAPELKARCLRRGAAAFLEKPVDTVTLLTAIERVFSSRRGEAPHPAQSTNET